MFCGAVMKAKTQRKANGKRAWRVMLTDRLISREGGGNRGKDAYLRLKRCCSDFGFDAFGMLRVFFHRRQRRERKFQETPPAAD